MEYHREITKLLNEFDANYPLKKKKYNEKFNKIFSKLRKMN